MSRRFLFGVRHRTISRPRVTDDEPNSHGPIRVQMKTARWNFHINWSFPFPLFAFFTWLSIYKHRIRFQFRSRTGEPIALERISILNLLEMRLTITISIFHTIFFSTIVIYTGFLSIPTELSGCINNINSKVLFFKSTSTMVANKIIISVPFCFLSLRVFYFYFKNQFLENIYF